MKDPSVEFLRRNSAGDIQKNNKGTPKIMTKSELINIVAVRADIPKTKATLAVNAVFDAIEETVAEGDKVSHPRLRYV